MIKRFTLTRAWDAFKRLCAASFTDGSASRYIYDCNNYRVEQRVLPSGETSEQAALYLYSRLPTNSGDQ